MSRLAPWVRMSATTSLTGFWNGLRPQAVGTTQNSHGWTQPRVASNTLLVTKRRLGKRSRRGKGQTGETQTRGHGVARTERPGGRVPSSCGPRILGVAHHHRVGVRLCVLGDQRDMRPAENDRDAARPEVIGEGVGADGGPRDDRESDEVHVEVERDVRDALIDATDGVRQLRRDERRERRQRERLIAERLTPRCRPGAYRAVPWVRRVRFEWSTVRA